MDSVYTPSASVDGFGDKGEKSTQKDYTDLCEKLTSQVRDDLKKIEDKLQADREYNTLTLKNHTLKLQVIVDIVEKQAQLEEKQREESTKLAATFKTDSNTLVEKLSLIERGLYTIFQKACDLETRVKLMEGILAGFSLSEHSPSQQNNNLPQGGSQGKAHNIYIWRMDSAKSTFPNFSECLREYTNSFEKRWLLFSRGPRFAVIDIAGLDAITTAGTILLCCFTSTVRIEAEPIIKEKKIIEQNPKVANRTHTLIFRYGDKAMPAKVVDEKNQELTIPCLNVYFDSNGFITNEYTTNALKKITTV